MNLLSHTHNISGRGLLSIAPAQGTIPAGDRVKLVVRFTPGLPAAVSEKFTVKVAHFEPQDVRGIVG